MPSTNNAPFTTVTIGRVESGKAVLVTDELEILELPVELLPTTDIGAALHLHLESTKNNSDEYTNIQEEILNAFGNAPDNSKIKNCLVLIDKSHTTLTIQWPLWHELSPNCRATVYSIEGFLNGRRLAANSIISPDESTLRLTGLDPGTDYRVKIEFRTSAGRFASDELIVQTPSLQDFTNVRVTLDNVNEDTLKDLNELGVTITDGFQVGQTSIVITGRNGPDLLNGPDDGELFRISKECNVPVVSQEWVKACKESGRMQSVSHFYTCASP